MKNRLFHYGFQTSDYQTVHTGWATTHVEARERLHRLTSAADVLGIAYTAEIKEFALTEIPLAEHAKR